MQTGPKQMRAARRVLAARRHGGAGCAHATPLDGGGARRTPPPAAALPRPLRMLPCLPLLLLLLLLACCACAPAAALSHEAAFAPRRSLRALTRSASSPPPPPAPPSPPPPPPAAPKPSPLAAVLGGVGGTLAAIAAVIWLLRRRARASAAAQAALRAFEKAAGKPVAHGVPVGPSHGLASLQRSVDALHDALQRQADSLRTASLLRTPAGGAKRWDVFLSYRREDHALVDIIADKLTLAGLRVFVDRRGAMAGKPFDSELFAAIAASTTFTPVITLAALHALSEGGTRDQEGAADFALGEALAALHLWRCGVVSLVYPLLVGPEVPSATDARGSDWAPLLGSDAFREARAALSSRPHAPTLALVEALCTRHPGTPPLAEDLRTASVRDLICGPHGGAAHRPPPAAPASSEVEEVEEVEEAAGGYGAPSTLQCGLLSFDACLLLGPTRDMDLHIRSRFAAHLRAALQRTAAEELGDDAAADAMAMLSAAHVAPPGSGPGGGAGGGSGGGGGGNGALRVVTHSRIVSEASPEALIPWADITLREPVGQGAFGTVHAALWGDTPVAVKLLSLVAPPRHALRQLQREGYLMASIRHPHVCACFGLIIDPPRYGLVLELCAGGTLTDALLAEDETAAAAALPGGASAAAAAEAAAAAARAPPRLAPLSMAQRCRWGAQLAAGMAYLHGRPPPLGPVIHGDLKSANLLLQQPGAMLKIGDFGLAKLRMLTTSSGVSAAAALAAGGACTVGWTAPEVLAAYDARLTPESDMYAFGMVLWELAARRLPWGRLTAGEVIDLVKAKGQRPPLPADCPLPLAEIITRCWAQSPEERPAHFDGVGRVLAELAVEQAEHDA
jgi:hypothetical protein